MKIVMLMLLLLLSGCAKVGCALQAFGSGVNGRPEPACLNQAPRQTMQCWTDTAGKNLYCQ